MFVCLFVFNDSCVSVSSPVLFFALFGREGGGGCDPDGPRTRGTSCAIPSWNVPKSIFGNGKTERVSPNCNRLMIKKCHQIKMQLFF
jgi:hypothetical protein